MNQFFHICILAGILLGGTVGFFSLKGSPDAQLLIGSVTALAYVVWGILHHKIQKDLHPKIVVEYVLVGVFLVTLLYFVLKG